MIIQMQQFKRSVNFASSREARVTTAIEGGRDLTEEEEQYMEALLDDADFYGQNLEYDDDSYTEYYEDDANDWDDADDSSEEEVVEIRRGKRVVTRVKKPPRPQQNPLMGRSRTKSYPPSIVAIVQKINDTYGYSKESLFEYYKHAYSRMNRQAKQDNKKLSPVTVGEFFDGYRAYLNSGFQIKSATSAQLATLKVALLPKSVLVSKPRAPRVTYSSSKELPDGYDGWSLGLLLAGKPMLVYFRVDRGASSASLVKTVRKYLTTLQADPLAFSLKFGTKKIVDLSPADFVQSLADYSAVRADPLILGGAGKKGAKQGGNARPNGKKKKQKKVSIMAAVGRAAKAVVQGIPKQVTDNLNFLSPCAAKLAIAIADPFDPRAVGVCGLVGNTQFSQKSSNYMTASCGAADVGMGFVAFSPTVASDCVHAYYTTTSTSANAIQILSANNQLQTGVTAWTATGLPHLASTLTNGASNSATTLQGRILAYGARVKWNGADLYRGGTIMTNHRSNHENVSVIGGTSGSAPALSNIAGWEGTVTSGITPGYFSVNCFAVNTAETNYCSDEAENSTNGSLTHPFSRGETEINGFTYTAASVSQGVPIACIAFNGATSNGASFVLETITHCEYVGSACRSQATASEVDPIGHEIVMNAAARLQRAMRTTPGLNASRVMRDLLVGAASSFSSIPPKTIRMGMKALKI